MTDLTETLSADHRRCDRLFAKAEGLMNDGDWEAARSLLAQFAGALEAHFRMEEEVLFPKLLAHVPGPVQVMLMEHAQMRQVLEALLDASAAGDRDGGLGQAETLFILLQQHNAKEEQILYPMADRTLAAGRTGLLTEMLMLGRETEQGGGAPA